MIVLDTNVISEVFKPKPAPGVLAWLQQQDDGLVFTTAVTRGELLYGLNIMANGKRREMLVSGLQRIFAMRFVGRVLPYDEAAADAYALILAQRRSSGRPTSVPDAMIAGIVRSRGATLATRNVRDFADCGITLVDPWQ
ncbi:MAG: type II toxin-antitoxin system VapC family toxin [Xanthomonadales bacterium]|nr:type II toxin-antitoxin system VapC family toxin [Xanthomonadales bacterium]